MTLLDMLPVITARGGADGLFANAISLGQIRQLDSISPITSDCPNVVTRETNSRNVLPNMRPDVATLTVSVSVVVGRCSEEQMIRPDAQLVVAVVTDEQSIGDRTVGDLPRHAVGSLVAARCPFDCDQHSVAARRASPDPFPASVVNSDLGPETRSSGHGWIIS